MIECLKKYFPHSADVSLLYFLENIGYICKNDGLSRPSSLLQSLKLLDIFEDLVIISGQFIITGSLIHCQCLFQWQALI
jgi:hypothetical protein